MQQPCDTGGDASSAGNQHLRNEIHHIILHEVPAGTQLPVVMQHGALGKYLPFAKVKTPVMFKSKV